MVKPGGKLEEVSAPASRAARVHLLFLAASVITTIAVSADAPCSAAQNAVEFFIVMAMAAIGP